VLADPDDLHKLVDQMLGYGLLSQLTDRPATHVAAYLARYAILIEYPVPALARRCATTPTALTEAAATTKAA
jgi:hypothetical protein